MEHLKSFIHVSTSYCHCNESILEERNYPAPIELEKIVKMVNDTTDDFQKIMTPKILQGLPNTYAFSKALAEDLVQKSGLPAGVARPSIGILNKNT